MLSSVPGGGPDRDPDLVLESDAALWVELRQGTTTIREAQQSGRLHTEGPRPRCATCSASSSSTVVDALSARRPGRPCSVAVGLPGIGPNGGPATRSGRPAAQVAERRAIRQSRRMNRGDAWRDKGGYFSWRPRAGDADEVQVFHVELGDPDAPALVLVHGFPTSSVDWFEVAERLSDRYRVCAMDFPGFGFSDKPLGWGYSLVRDAEVLEHYLAEVLGLESMIMLAHDRGSSVAMIHTTGGESRVRLEHLFVTNGNIFLPLSNLTQAQRLMLDPATGPRCSRRPRPSSSRSAWARPRTRRRVAPTIPRSRR